MNVVNYIVNRIKVTKKLKNNLYYEAVCRLSNVFNRMFWPRLFILLRDLQTLANMYNLLLSYFENQKVSIRILESKARKKLRMPGSILGVILWNVYLDDLLDFLQKEESIIDFAAYVDNLYILINGNM